MHNKIELRPIECTHCARLRWSPAKRRANFADQLCKKYLPLSQKDTPKRYQRSEWHVVGVGWDKDCFYSDYINVAGDCCNFKFRKLEGDYVKFDTIARKTLEANQREKIKT
jgi:hypothetical protein